MKLTQRELVLGLVTLTAALYGGLLYFGSGQLQVWRQLRLEREQLLDSIRRSQSEVEKHPFWSAKMDDLQNLMPVFPRDKRMDVHWLSEVEGKATAHELKIFRHEVGSEQKEGPIYELPVFCRRWEGTLDALVHFLFDLQAEGAMLDVRYLYIRPKDKVIHDGRFDLYCAYRREGS